MTKVILRKFDIDKLKEIQKVSCSTKSQNKPFLEKVRYNPSKNKLMSTDGKIAFLVDLDKPWADSKEDINYTVTIIDNTSIMLEEVADNFPRVEQVFPTLDKDAKKTEEFEVSKKSETLISLSFFVNQLDKCLNLNYLTNLPKAKYSYYKVNKVGYFKAKYSMGMATIVLMPLHRQKKGIFE